jgi:hypothetical protein
MQVQACTETLKQKKDKPKKYTYIEEKEDDDNKEHIINLTPLKVYLCKI